MIQNTLLAHTAPVAGPHARTAAMLRALLLCFLLAWIAGLADAAEPAKLLPVDEGSKDASWVTFKKRLQTAAQKHDRKFLLSIIDRNVRNGPADARGIDEFTRRWNVGEDDSRLWEELASALALGSAYIQREKAPPELCTPYILAKWPETLDPYDHGVITVKEALVKAEPSARSPTLGALSHDVVTVTDWDVADVETDNKQRWVRLRDAGGTGYVPAEHIRSPIENAACFARTPAGWRLTGFAPGGGN